MIFVFPLLITHDRLTSSGHTVRVLSVWPLRQGWPLTFRVGNETLRLYICLFIFYVEYPFLSWISKTLLLTSDAYIYDVDICATLLLKWPSQSQNVPDTQTHYYLRLIVLRRFKKGENTQENTWKLNLPASLLVEEAGEVRRLTSDLREKKLAEK